MKCPYCKKKAVRTTGEEVYPKRPDLHHKAFFLCRPCNAYVGCHESGQPLGDLANAELRKLRVAAHGSFDILWRMGYFKRHAAYTWLAEALGIPVKQCHIGQFREEACLKVFELCTAKFKTLKQVSTQPSQAASTNTGGKT